MSQPRLTGLDPHQTQFSQLIHACSHRRAVHEVYRDFCELAAICLSNAVDKIQYEKREARYLEIIGHYEREDVQRLSHMLACITLSLELGYKDSLGELFGALELSDHWRGQYFTPYPVASMMARVTLADVDSKMLEERGGFITLAEPAAGAGVMIIAAAHALRDQGINYQQSLHVTATDVDVTAVHMTYIQLSLLNVPAIVIHGNSLTAQHHDYWVTPAHVLGLWDVKLKRRTDEVAAQADVRSNLETSQAAPPDPAAALSVACERITQARVVDPRHQLDLF